MYTSTFTFAKKRFDDEFHRLDEAIAALAKTIPGYLGEETWENSETGLVCNVYYWETLEALQQLVQHPRHLEAKARQHDWLAGYQVVTSHTHLWRCHARARAAGSHRVARSALKVLNAQTTACCWVEQFTLSGAAGPAATHKCPKKHLIISAAEHGIAGRKARDRRCRGSMNNAPVPRRT